jgi:acylpyruvate hydrolase
MRFVTFDSGQGPQAGMVVDDHVGALTSPGEGDLGTVLRHGDLPDAPIRASIPLSDVRLLRPIPEPRKIVCFGLNYHAHAEEQGAEAPETPTIFAKYANALADPGARVTLPRYSRKVDYEAEVAFVIGDRCRDVPEDRAMDHVAGYTLLNDLSARDQQFRTPQWMLG